MQWGYHACLQDPQTDLQEAAPQLLLRIGILRSAQAPTVLHPYGYLKDKFVWSLVSTVGIFCWARASLLLTELAICSRPRASLRTSVMAWQVLLAII